jgi:ABC-type glycerol-3-phosphate transport system permease component
MDPRFFKSIPKDIEEAAMGILSAVIFAFTPTIQEFTYALTLITSSGQQTVGVGVPTNLVRGDIYFWGSLMAACLITSIPVASSTTSSSTASSRASPWARSSSGTKASEEWTSGALAARHPAAT